MQAPRHAEIQSHRRFGLELPALAAQAALAALAVLLLAWPAAQANDFPTLARVQYVAQCQNTHPGPLYEMQSKCACAVDHLAGQLSYEQFEALKTATDAMSIGGERGGALRDNPAVRPMINHLKALEAQAAQACFLRPPR